MNRGRIFGKVAAFLFFLLP
uniref:Uncharacterized protein n=1 Tax=Rhizophora mucronata TaxID=61149 RepID=A0A2P2NER2_RHIMU